MKNIKFYPLAVYLLCLTVFISCSKTDTIPQSATKQMNLFSQMEKVNGVSNKSHKNTIVTGAGTFGPEHFSLNALKKKDGIITGHIVYHSVDYDLWGTIDCMVIVGNEARLGGTVTRVKYYGIIPPDDHPYVFAWHISDPFQITVQDNGEGNNMPPDKISGIAYSIYDCATSWSGPITNLEHGNIQIKQ